MRVKSRRRTIHRGASGGQMICGTTQIPPPQDPVDPSVVPPVSAYLHRNVQKSMEMNQTVQAVFVVLIKDVLLLVRIALNLPIPVHRVLLQRARLQME